MPSSAIRRFGLPRIETQTWSSIGMTAIPPPTIPGRRRPTTTVEALPVTRKATRMGYHTRQPQGGYALLAGTGISHGVAGKQTDRTVSPDEDRPGKEAPND
jgi:hypothetical protein